MSGDEKAGALAEPEDEGREDERHEDRGRVSRRAADGDSDAIPVSKRAAERALGWALWLVVGTVFGGAGGTTCASLFRAPEEARETRDARKKSDDEGRKKLEDKLDKVLESQQRIELRLTTLESQGTREVVEKLEARLRQAEEQISALRALESRK